MEVASYPPDHLEILLKMGAVDYNIIKWIEMVNIMEIFGWTPDIIRQMDAKDYNKIRAVLIGRDKRIKKEMQHGGVRPNSQRQGSYRKVPIGSGQSSENSVKEER